MHFSAHVLSSVVLAANTLMQSGDDAAKSAHLPGIAAGSTIATVAFTEPNGKWDEAGITMEASGSGSDVTLNGTKSFVLDGHLADLIIVAARSSAGVSLYTVAGDAAGLTRTALSTMDQTRRQAKLEFSNTPATLLGAEGKGWDILSTVLDLAAIGLAAEQVGGAQFVLEMAVQYAKDVCSSDVPSARSRPSSTSAPTCSSRSNQRNQLRTTASGVQAK